MNAQQLRAKLQGMFRRNAEETGTTGSGNASKTEDKPKAEDKPKSINWMRVGKITGAIAAGLAAVGGSYYVGHRNGSKSRTETEALMGSSSTL